jgi:ABC-2 type transport system permease protein
MTSAFLYYLACSGVNRLVHRLKRLRKPRYLASTVGGLAYIYFFVFRQAGGPRHPAAGGVAQTGLPMEAMQPLLETLFAALVLVLVLLPWFALSPGKGLAYSEAEVQFLFPAPLSRRAVLNFRILRMQAPILFGVIVFGVLFRRGLPVPHYAFLLVAIWLLYTFMSLYRMGASLSKLSLLQRGFGPWHRIALASALVAAAGLFTAWWLGSVRQVGLSPQEWSPSGIGVWVDSVSGSGPLWFVLAPFRAMTRLAYAPDWSGFARLLPSALGVMLITYLWVVRSGVRFEELALEQARQAASSGGEGGRASRLNPLRAAADPFRLPESAAPYLAILWKNLIGAGGLGTRWRVLILSVLLGVFIVSAGRGTSAILDAVGVGCVSVAILLCLMGPLMFRDDLRVDLLRADQLKSWPLPGWIIVLGEVLAPAVMLAVIQWVLIVLGAILLPSSVRTGIGTGHRLAYGAGAALLLPMLSLASVVAQNAFALLIPGWVQLGKTERRGIEASGQRLISMGITVMVLFVAVVPSAAVFAGIYFIVSPLAGIVAIPLAALGAAIVLAIECAAGILLVGRLFDRLDISLEVLTES